MITVSACLTGIGFNAFTIAERLEKVSLLNPTAVPKLSDLSVRRFERDAFPEFSIEMVNDVISYRNIFRRVFRRPSRANYNTALLIGAGLNGHLNSIIISLNFFFQ